VLGIASWARRPEKLLFPAQIVARCLDTLTSLSVLRPSNRLRVFAHAKQDCHYATVTARGLRRLVLGLQGPTLFQALSIVARRALAGLELDYFSAGDVHIQRLEEASGNRSSMTPELVFRRILLPRAVEEILKHHSSRSKRREWKQRQVDARRQLRATLGLTTEDSASDSETNSNIPIEAPVTWRQHAFSLAPAVLRIALIAGLVCLLLAANQRGWAPFSILGVRLSPWFLLFLAALLTFWNVALILVVSALVYLAIASFADLFPFDEPQLSLAPESVGLICLLGAWILLRIRLYLVRRSRSTDSQFGRRTYRLENGFITADDPKRTGGARVALEDIRLITTSKPAVRVFGFGDVWLHTAEGRLVLSKVPHPFSVKQVLEGAIAEWRERKRQIELQPIDDYIREWLIAYTAAMERGYDSIAPGRERVLTDDPTLRGYLRVLVLTALPVNMPLLQHWNEWEDILQVLRQVPGRISVTHIRPATRERIEAELERGYQVVHFIGHGQADPRTRRQALILEDNYGRAEAISNKELAEVLSEGRVRLVMLNVCNSDQLARDLVESESRIDSVVGMKGPIPDRVGIEFARYFYEGLAAGKPIGKAFDQAKTLVRRQFTPNDAEIPVLETRRRTGRSTFFVPRPGEGKARVDSGEPRYSNLRKTLPDPGDSYCDGSLIRLARALQNPQHNIVILSGSQPEHRLKVAHAAAERNSWRFGGGIVCVSAIKRDSLEDTILTTVTEVLGLNLVVPSQGVITSTLQELAEQGKSVLLILPEIEPTMVLPNSSLLQLLASAVESSRNKVLVTCSQLSEASRELPGLVHRCVNLFLA